MTEILNLIKIGEGHSLEFKESYTDTISKTICAFANATGGKIFLGVTDKGQIKEYKLPMVKIENSKTLFILTFKRPNLQIDSYQTRVLGIGKETVEKKVGEKVGDTELKIINLIKNNTKITYSELAKEVNIAEKNIYKNILKLKEKGIIRRVGPDKGGHWEIVKK